MGDNIIKSSVSFVGQVSYQVLTVVVNIIIAYYM